MGTHRCCPGLQPSLQEYASRPVEIKSAQINVSLGSCSPTPSTVTSSNSRRRENTYAEGVLDFVKHSRHDCG